LAGFAASWDVDLFVHPKGATRNAFREGRARA
jgi:hypothetical protein